MYKNDGFCPECAIGLNGIEIKMRHCQNCRHSWDSDDEMPADESESMADSCPSCTEPFDEVDMEYQICHYCGYNNN